MPKYSQVFLKDTKICARICHALDNEHFDRLVEIGPGAGALTACLFPKYSDKMEVIEIDRDLIPNLEKKFPGLNIINKDFLETDLEDILPSGRIAFISNLPYDCSTVILDRILSFPRLACAVLMFQKEVALRIKAVRNDSNYGMLSVLSALRADSELVCHVNAGSFNPVPAVDSAVLKFYPKPVPGDIKNVQNLTKKAFMHRRKTLLNSLQLCGADKSKIIEAMAQLGIPERARAQELSPDTYLKLAGLLM